MPGNKQGTILQGRYRVGALLAEGGMGAVYRAERIGVERPVAVKYLHAVLSDRPGVVDRFEREARATARLNHPHCVGLVDFGLDDGSPFLVMEYVEGKTLSELLDKDSALGSLRAVKIVRQILAGLSHAHERGILHRDLKPANIMIIDAVGTEDFVKILDFGLAKIVGPDEDTKDVTIRGIAIGTPGYMSPEQAAGVPSDVRSDIYCAGALLYHLVTGKKAFSGDDVHAVLRRHREETPPPAREMTEMPVSEHLESVIAKSMERDPVRRYQTAAEMRQALADTPEWRQLDLTPSGLPVPRAASAPRSGERRGEPPAPRPRRGSLGGFLFTLLLGAGGGLTAAYYTGWQPRAIWDAQFAVKVVTPPPRPPAPPPPKPTPVAAKPTEVAAKAPEKKPAPPPPDLAQPPPPPPDLAPALLPPPMPLQPPPDLGSTDVDDGSGEDDRQPPAEVVVPDKTPEVKTLAEIKTLLKKGDYDSAIAGLYRLRRLPAPPPRVAETAAILGHIYFDKKWWTDALREYRYACRVDPAQRAAPTLIHNTVRMLGDKKTAPRARRLIVDMLGKNAIPTLRLTQKSGATPELRRQATLTLAALSADGKQVAKRR